MNILHVLEGWRNHLVPPEELKELIQKVHEERMAICNECPEQSENAKQLGYRTIRKDIHCKVCKCPLISKTKSLKSECPLEKWKALITEDEQEQIEKQLEDGKL